MTDSLKTSPDTEKGGYALEVELQDVYEEGESGIDPVYHAKARVLNRAFQEVGMGKYQWFLFVVTGFGWFSDNLWPVATTLILTPTVAEFGYNGPFIKLAWALGTLVGAATWGIASDIWGRKWAFNITLFMTGIFATAAGGSPNAIALCSFVAVWSVGTGGNLPVDSAVFLEFIPASHQYLLTVLSVWWALGQLLGALVAWPLIANFSCSGTTPATCPKSENMGWRYFMYAVGGFMLLLSFVRFFIFNLYESPRFLMSRGNDKAAVEVVHKIAKYNGKTSRLTVEMLKEAGDGAKSKDGEDLDVSAKAIVARNLRQISMSHIKPLFATKKLAISTTLLMIIWGLIGLAFPLYNGFVTIFFQQRGADFGDGSTYITYRNLVILSVIGIPGALLAGWMVEIPRLGRNGTLAISTILTGVFLFCSTTARTSNAFLGWNARYTFTSNIMYGVLFAVSPELFPTKDRGTGNTLVGLSNRLVGIAAPIIALYSNLTTSVPIWIAAALFISAGLLSFLLPFDPRGKASL
ncbi:MFS general substrate transporter [Cristinia sonorae]|uniref:MFS general substrate transporter n=1 Tax=Cristinia sonorae TaxID=1940300 RepID=A0A8K0UGU7_9AGAR|nr:MFS general substrate transporter [Cristinia sonorae]